MSPFLAPWAARSPTFSASSSAVSFASDMPFLTAYAATVPAVASAGIKTSFDISEERNPPSPFEVALSFTSLALSLISSVMFSVSSAMGGHFLLVVAPLNIPVRAVP